MDSKFEPLKIEHKSLFDAAFKNNPPEISEFTFTNLYSWRNAYGFEAAEFRGFIILKASKGRNRGFFDPIGTGDRKEAIIEILKDTNGPFIRMPEAAKALFDNDAGFIIEKDAPNSDYLFRIEDLVTLAGRKYDGKRNLIKKFKGEHEYNFIELDASNVHRCLDFEEKWCSIKDCDGVEGLDNERAAIKEMAGRFLEFGVIGGAIEIKSAIAALALAERLNPDTMVMHILKADPAIPGLYQVMMNEFLKRRAAGFEYVNLEQDLGVEGLRRSKESYHPARMINKYTITLKQ